MGRKIDNIAKSFDLNKDIVDSLRHQLMISNEIINSLKNESNRKEEENSKILSEKNKVINNLEKSLYSLKELFKQKDSLLLKTEKRYLAELEKFSNKENEASRLKEKIIIRGQEFAELTKESDLLKNHCSKLELVTKKLIDKRDTYFENLTILKSSLENADILSKKERKAFNEVINALKNKKESEIAELTRRGLESELELKSQISKLESDLNKNDKLLLEKELKEKQLLIDLNEKFRGLISPTKNIIDKTLFRKQLLKPKVTVKQNMGSEEELKILEPMVETAITHGKSIKDIEHSLHNVGYSEENIKKVISRLSH